MKLKEWANGQGVSYRTALNWFHAGTMPVPARQLPTGTILVDPPAVPAGRAVAYCRVSSSGQRADLDRQAGRVAQECGARGITLSATVTEVGSNAHRPKLRKLLADPTVTTIVVEHRDRLARFGVEDLAAALSAGGRGVLVLDDGELNDDLEQDTIEVLTSVCARLYGRRSARRRAQAAVRAMAAEGHTP